MAYTNKIYRFIENSFKIILKKLHDKKQEIINFRERNYECWKLNRTVTFDCNFYNLKMILKNKALSTKWSYKF